MKKINFSSYDFPSNDNNQIRKATLTNFNDLIDYLYLLLHDNICGKVILDGNSIIIETPTIRFFVKVETA